MAGSEPAEQVRDRIKALRVAIRNKRPSAPGMFRRVYEIPVEQMARILAYQFELGLPTEVAAVRELLDQALRLFEERQQSNAGGSPMEEHSMSRVEHISRARTKALDLVDRGELSLAVASMSSDMAKHPETATPTFAARTPIGQMAIRAGAREVRRWVDGFV